MSVIVTSPPMPTSQYPDDIQYIEESLGYQSIHVPVTPSESDVRRQNNNPANRTSFLQVSDVYNESAVTIKKIYARKEWTILDFKLAVALRFDVDKMSRIFLVTQGGIPLKDDSKTLDAYGIEEFDLIDAHFAHEEESIELVLRGIVNGRVHLLVISNAYAFNDVTDIEEKGSELLGRRIELIGITPTDTVFGVEADGLTLDFRLVAVERKTF